jgi:hypothetical protein
MIKIGSNGNDRNRFAARIGVVLLGVAALIHAPLIFADDAGPAARAVRLSSVDGQVQITQARQTLADAAVANTPLFEGTTVTTADDGRAEIQFEDGSVARLSPNSSATLTVLHGAGSNGEAEISLDGGLAYFELQGAGQAGSIKVKFADSVVSSSGFSVLRINLDNPPGELAVFSGNAHLDRGSAASVDIHGGETAALSANDESRYTLNETIEPDSWDSWNSDRDQVMTSEAADKTGATKDYSNSSNPAWNDLDANGNWYNVPGQGNIWSPYEAANAGWDPYGNGNWGFSPGFGYTWISANPWGYIPYQCGMWNYYQSFGWGWAPGSGGCNPWWNGAGYYGPNIGNGWGGYRPPLRPRLPKHPLGGGHSGLIAVNRRPSGPSGALPARDRTTVASIGGHPVMPLHPVSARPVYEHSASGFVNRTVVGTAGARPGNPGMGGMGAPQRGAGPTFGASRVANAPAAGNRGFASAPRPSGGGAAPAPVSHAAAGGGGGGAAHVSAGGGGGGSRH